MSWYKFFYLSEDILLWSFIVFFNLVDSFNCNSGRILYIYPPNFLDFSRLFALFSYFALTAAAVAQQNDLESIESVSESEIKKIKRDKPMKPIFDASYLNFVLIGLSLSLMHDDIDIGS